jgi:hypothetical protein
MFLLDPHQGIGGPITCSIVYKSAKNILSVFHHWNDPRQDKISNSTKIYNTKTTWQIPPTTLKTSSTYTQFRPQFYNKLTEDKFTSAQWLAKVMNHKEGAN